MALRYVTDDLVLFIPSHSVGCSALRSLKLIGLNFVINKRTCNDSARNHKS